MLVCIFSIKYSQPEGPPGFTPLKWSSLQGERRVLASPFTYPLPHQADFACSAPCDVLLHVAIMFRAQRLTHKAPTGLIRKAERWFSLEGSNISLRTKWFSSNKGLSEWSERDAL